MVDDPTPKPSEQKFEMVFRASKLKSPFRAPPVDRAMCLWLGYAAVTWNLFEQALLDYFDRLVAHNKSSEDWLILRGKKRYPRFRRELVAAFPTSPAIIAMGDRVILMARDLGPTRNTLLHGWLSFLFPGDFAPVRIEAASTSSKGASHLVSLDHDGVETLAHDMSHLLGLMGSFMEPDPRLGLPLSDIELLRTFAETSRRDHRPLPLNAPIEAIPQAPRRSSPG